MDSNNNDIDDIVQIVITTPSVTSLKLSRKEYQDKIRGMLTGHALGDALGHPHEFHCQTDKYTGKLEYRAKHTSRFQGTKYAAIGQCTDDTDMTMALCHSLINEKGYNREKVILAYEGWANQCKTGMGNNTRLLLKGVKTVKGYEGRYQKALQGKLPGMKASALSEIKSNGSLMRCCPLAVLMCKDNHNDGDVNPFDVVYIDTKITNPNDVNMECNILYYLVLNCLLEGKTPMEALMASVDFTFGAEPGVPVILEAYEQLNNSSEDVKPRDITENKGYVVHSFYCAMWALDQLSKNPDIKYCTLIDQIINWGGDTDTNAAIAGAIIGLHHGYEKLMCEDITKENIEIMMNADLSTSECAGSNWKKYHPDNIPMISEKLTELFYTE